MKITAFFKLVRFKNLVIVALTQYLLQYLVLEPALHEAQLLPILDKFHFFLLVFTTVLIAAGGYLVNDILDYEMDVVNKPEKVFVNRVFAKQTVWVFYWISIFVGFAIAWYLAFYVKNLPLVSIFPAAVLLLFFYSKSWKKKPLLGNVVVAVFCAFVAGVVLFAERENFARMGESGREVTMLFGGYLVFAFLSTLLREIVKDIEDIEGDREIGLATLPIRYGVNTAKIWALGAGTALAISLLYFLWWLSQMGKWLGIGFTVALVLLPLLYLLFLIGKAQLKSHYSKASSLAKMLMFSGLILLLICKFT